MSSRRLSRWHVKLFFLESNFFRDSCGCRENMFGLGWVIIFYSSSFGHVLFFIHFHPNEDLQSIVFLNTKLNFTFFECKIKFNTSLLFFFNFHPYMLSRRLSQGDVKFFFESLILLKVTCSHDSRREHMWSVHIFYSFSSKCRFTCVRDGCCEGM